MVEVKVIAEKVNSLEEDVREIKALQAENTRKLDELLRLAAMAQGAGWLLIKFGGWLSAIIAAFWTLYVNWRNIFPH